MPADSTCAGRTRASGAACEQERQPLAANEASALFLQYGESLKAFAWGLLRNRELAQEVVQTAFGRALECAGAIPQESRRAWLYRVTHNEAMLVRRRLGLAERARQELAEEQSQRGVSAGPPSPEEVIERREQLCRVRAALQQLPEHQQVVVRMRMYEDKTFAEIAAALQVPLGTVLTRMRLALGRLERALKEDRTP